MVLFAILAPLGILLAILSLRGDRAIAEYVKTFLERLSDERVWPAATVMVPVKGHDEHLARNLASLAELDYPDYELIVVARDAQDIPNDVVPDRARLIIAGQGDVDTGEKVNNLRAAVRAARAESEVLAFADSDGRVRPGWLKSLVTALDTPGAGLSTGFRWHLPDPPDFWSLFRAVWNSAAAGVFRRGDNRFAWGGAMAIRRETFSAVRVEEAWRGAISDDYRISQAVHNAGLRIVYAPGSLVVCDDHTGAREFLSWIRRQMTITRIYDPPLWWAGLVAHLVYCGAMVASVWAAVGGLGLWGEYALVAQLGLGMLKGTNRTAIARVALREEEGWFKKYGWVLTWWVPLATWVWLFAFLASAIPGPISWRGVRYRVTRTSVERLSK
jgi:GT2 family glycosyltransferase